LQRGGLPAKKAVMRFDLMLNDTGITAEELCRIQTSLRILYAENDMVKEEHIQEMGRLIPGATVQQIRRCNHLTILHNQLALEDMKDYLLSDHPPLDASQCREQR
jgi:hypothetical protein